MNVEQFKGSFNNLAKPSLFEVSGFNLPNTARFMVKAASIPAVQVGTIEVPYQSRKIKIAGDRTYQPWTITVINSTEFDLHDAFNLWMDSINDPVGNFGVDPAAYKRDGEFAQLDTNDNVIKVYNFVGAFPQEVSSIETNWETTDAYQEFTVTLEYDYHL